MYSIKERFSNINEINLFQRIDSKHILDLYLGIDQMSRYTLFLISDTEPIQIYSSQLINVNIGLRKDNKWGLSFSLVDDEFEDLFSHFCADIIESSREVPSRSKGTEYICERYIQWQDMLSRYKEMVLSPNEIKGLIAELLFLKDYLFPLYGEEKALDSWIGPDKAAQDFVCGDTWFEIKASVSGADSIRISSIAQLDTITEGELVIVYLDKTSQADGSKTLLNDIFNEIYGLLQTDELRRKLKNRLLKLGYFERPEYDEHPFKLKAISRYCVDLKFPCLRRNNLPESITAARYELSISAISSFLKEE